jgi:hypothetical protein
MRGGGKESCTIRCPGRSYFCCLLLLVSSVSEHPLVFHSIRPILHGSFYFFLFHLHCNFGVFYPALLHFLDHREHSRAISSFHLGEQIFGMKEKEKSSKVTTLRRFLCGLFSSSSSQILYHFRNWRTCTIAALCSVENQCPLVNTMIAE